MLREILSFEQPCLLSHVPPPSSVRTNKVKKKGGFLEIPQPSIPMVGQTHPQEVRGELWGSRRRSLGRFSLLYTHTSSECAFVLLHEASHTSEGQHDEGLESRAAV